MNRKWFIVLVLAAALLHCKREKGPEPAPEEGESPPAESAAPAAAPAKNFYIIGVSFRNLASPYQVALRGAAQDESRRLGVVRLIGADAMNDPRQEQENLQRFRNEKADCVAVQPVDAELSRPALLALNEAEVPLVVFADRASAINQVTFVGFEEGEAGQLLAEWLMNSLRAGGRSRGRGIYLHGSRGQIEDQACWQGVQSALEQAGMQGRMELVEEYADDDRLKAQNITRRLLQTDRNFSFLLARSDEMLLGALAAVEELGLADRLALAGVGGGLEVLNAISAGRVAAVVFRNPEPQGAGAVQACFRHLRGESLPSEMVIPFQLVTAENVQEFLDLAHRVYTR